MSTMDLSGLPLFATSANAGMYHPTAHSRGSRLTVIKSYNNVCDVSHKTVSRGDSTVDGYFFTATNAVARGVAETLWLNVYHLGGSKFVAARI